MSDSARAADAKERGNKFFKDGNLAESIKQYRGAEKLDPTNPVYPSNLSAALFETGDYLQCAKAILRSWSHNPEPTLAIKLSARLAKALCHGVHNRSIDFAYISTNENAIKSLGSLSAPDASGNHALWAQWRTLYSKLENFADLSHVAKVRLSKMPISKGTPDDSMFYFNIGTDDILSLVDGWGTNNPALIDFDNFVHENSEPLAFLFGGVGDARHVFGTLVGFGREQKKRRSADKETLTKAYLTLLDCHAAQLARDLVLCWLINTLAKDDLDRTARLEVQCALVYTFIAQVMPDYAYSRLIAAIRELIAVLSSSQPILPSWVHVDENAIEPILLFLRHWSTSTGTLKTSTFLKHHTYMGPMERLMELARWDGAKYASYGSDPYTFQRKLAEEKLETMGDAELSGLGNILGLRGAPISKVKEMIKREREKFILLLINFEIDENFAWDLSCEAVWYRVVKAFLPPSQLWHRHAGFETFREVQYEQVPKQKLKRVAKEVEKTWKPNITLMDGTEPVDYPDPLTDIFAIIQDVAAFNKEMSLEGVINPSFPAFSYVSTFFDNVVAVIREFGESLQLEFICGDLHEEMCKIRLQTDDRPDIFPKKFTRIWLSNVPDYTNGTLNTAIYVLPVLQDTPDAALSSNVMFNPNVFESNAQLCYTPGDLTRYLGIRTLNDQSIMDMNTYSRYPIPRPLSELASRENLRDWLTRIFISVLYPGIFQRRPNFVQLSNGLTAFIALLVELENIGYPGHWLADILESLMNGTLVTDRQVYRGEIPRPLSDLNQKGNAHSLRTDPWVADLEAIVASARDGLPFALSLRSDLASKASDIGHYRAAINANMFYTNPMMRFPDNDPVLSLLFYKDRSTLHHRITSTPGTMNWFLQDLPDIIEGRTSPPPGTFHILTAPDTVDLERGEVTWRISKAKMDVMRREKWSMVVWRADFYVDRDIDASKKETVKATKTGTWWIRRKVNKEETATTEEVDQQPPTLSRASSFWMKKSHEEPSSKSSSTDEKSSEGRKVPTRSATDFWPLRKKSQDDVNERPPLPPKSNSEMAVVTTSQTSPTPSRSNTMPEPANSTVTTEAPLWLLNAFNALEYITNEHPKAMSIISAILITAGSIPSIPAISAGAGGAVLASGAAHAIGAIAVGVGQALSMSVKNTTQNSNNQVQAPSISR
ncbi:hypothetical protein H0H93_015430 [Arthromyces matolae]|nr:hypothetical protein H0H93_015430 [Arthromyces matolae]